MNRTLLLPIVSFASVSLVAFATGCSSSSSSGGAADSGTAADTSTGDTGTTGDDGGSTGDSAAPGDTGTAGEGGGPLPTIVITAASADGGIPSITTSMMAGTGDGGSQIIADIPFTTTNFTLTDPNATTCQASSNNCGHVHILVDGATCTPAGAPYNNDAIASPAVAILSSCPTALGMHNVSLELHHQDHTAIVDAANMTIAASLQFDAK